MGSPVGNRSIETAPHEGRWLPRSYLLSRKPASLAAVLRMACPVVSRGFACLAGRGRMVRRTELRSGKLSDGSADDSSRLKVIRTVSLMDSELP
jgi:hypothetical protein